MTTASNPNNRSNMLFAPVAPLLRKLSLSSKFAVIALALGLPMAGLSYSVLKRANADLNFTRGEITGAHAANELINLMRAVKQHRGLHGMVLAGAAEGAACPFRAFTFKIGIGGFHAGLAEINRHVGSV